MSVNKRCLLVHVHGHVQGVFFRHECRLEAVRLGITGWVKNMPGGHVQALICGDEAQLSAMQAWLAHGPPMADVERVQTDETTADPVPPSFQIAY